MGWVVTSCQLIWRWSRVTTASPLASLHCSPLHLVWAIMAVAAEARRPLSSPSHPPFFPPHCSHCSSPSSLSPTCPVPKSERFSLTPASRWHHCTFFAQSVERDVHPTTAAWFKILFLFASSGGPLSGESSSGNDRPKGAFQWRVH